MTVASGSLAVIRKLVSSPLTACSPLVGNQTPKPPREFGLPIIPAACTIHVSRRDSPDNSQRRSQGRTKKLLSMTACISGSRNISAVPVFCDKLSGAMISARRRGKEVRCGFRERASSMGWRDDGGVTRVIPYLWHQIVSSASMGRGKIERLIHESRIILKARATVAKEKYRPETQKAASTNKQKPQDSLNILIR